MKNLYVLKRPLLCVSLGSALIASFFAAQAQNPPPRMVPAGMVPTQLGAARINPAFWRNPPTVKRAFIERLAKPSKAGNVRLTVEFQADRRLGTTHAFEADGRIVVLRDDGRGADTKARDRIYSALVTVKTQELTMLNRDLTAMRRRMPTVPVFRQRRIISTSRVTLFDTNRLAKRQKIQIFPFPLPCTLTTDPEKTLLIRDLKVVEDPKRTFNPCAKVGTPMGRWTFGHLMREMVNEPVTGIDPSKFARKWVEKWLTTQTVNSDPIAARTAMQNLIITPWEQASGVGPGGKLNLARAPFKLLAIVNRVDLRDNAVYGGTNAGEGRFVFGAVDMRPAMNCAPLQFTVIFEYGIRKRGCAAIRNWGKQWYNLRTLPLGSPAYNAALQAITDQFVTRGADPTKLPNKSALNQLRTNEIALDNPWELREFRLAKSGLLDQVTVKQTPAFVHNNTANLANYVNSNEAAILANDYVVPDEFPAGTPFLGGAAPTPGGMFWQAPGIGNNNARHNFSLGTCSGCHARETDTRFTHVKPAAFGSVADLSGFLTGITVSDPVDGTPRKFDDLERRCQDLTKLVKSPCLFQLFFDPLRLVH
ncbi:MAG: hypothetical protein M3347_09365 [Armatimonadota bacterium]|nr:hypothetical protein [Armatimonadota bacterium]